MTEKDFDQNSVEAMAEEIDRIGLPLFAETFLDQEIVFGEGFTMSPLYRKFMEDGAPFFDEVRALSWPYERQRQCWRTERLPWSRD